MESETVKNLAMLGYWPLYGGDGYLHIVPRNQRGAVSRGSRALCGATARGHDYHNTKPTCEDCMRAVIAIAKSAQHGVQPTTPRCLSPATIRSTIISIGGAAADAHR